jgi:uncharacterized protein (DUF1697 family)
VATAKTWIALLRAVNLGSTNRVPMAELRRVVAELGGDDVRTYIASGNVLFAHPEGKRGALAAELAEAVERAFGVRSTIVLRTARELAGVLAAHPFGPDTSHTHVTFLEARPGRAAVDGLDAVEIAPDRFSVRGADVYLHYPNGVQGSRLTSALLERELGVRWTTRTWRTVTKLAELAGA